MRRFFWGVLAVCAAAVAAFGGITLAQFEQYQKLCAQGRGVACYNLGTLYNEGTDVAQNKVRAADFFKKACDAGDLAGCVKIGDLELEAGDVIMAAHHYLLNCEKGDKISCKRVGNIYNDGVFGVAKNPAKAKIFYKKSCDLGDTGGCTLYNMVTSSGY